MGTLHTFRWNIVIWLVTALTVSLNYKIIKDKGQIMKINSSLALFFLTVSTVCTEDKFQKCCGERKLYFRGDCYSPLQQRPWYSVYGEWNCQRVYLSLPFGLISDKTSPRDPVWEDCQDNNNL